MSRPLAAFAGLIVTFFLACSLWNARPVNAQTLAQAGNPLAVRTYAGVLRRINPHLRAWQSHDLAAHLLINANRWKLDVNMLTAIVTVESAWRTHAHSWAGALGLGQLMPSTAKTLHVNPRDPYQNLQGAARYLHRLLNVFSDRPDRYALTFAAYNAGPKAVEQFGGIPPYGETEHYVVKVMAAWERISRVIHIPAAAAITRAGSESSPDLTYWTRLR